ncbi:MAG: efflux RND transporter periplasmic adaptor subunit [Alphaproteobacteria bacterium]|nr:efflux RND transporter periplasmic adaptor subunit [Alphaproteobacteria bacterium]
MGSNFSFLAPLINHRHSRPIVGGVIAFIVCILFGKWMLHKDPVPKPAEIFSVGVVKSIAKDYSPTLKLTGNTKAFREVTIKSEAAGRVIKILVEKGQIVKKGQEILQILDDNKAELLSSSKLKLSQKEIELHGVKALKTKAFKTETDFLSASADLKAAKADLQKTERTVDNLIIKAPIDGYYEKNLVTEGDYVNAGDPVSFLVVLNPLKLIVNVPESEISFIQMGQKANVLLASQKDPIPATVIYVSKVADKNTRTFIAELSIDNTQMLLADGITAFVSIEKSPVKAHVIPTSSLALNDQGMLGINIIEQQNKTNFKPVDIAVFDRDHAIVPGLPDEVILITTGGEFTKPGQTVNPVEASPK